MRFKQWAATAFVLALSSCSAPTQAIKKQVPLTEPPACAKVEKKCDCQTLFSKLRKHLEKSDIVLVGEVHSWVAHYAEIASNMESLTKLGVKKIFIELPRPLDKYIAKYQKLRKQYLNPDISKKEEKAIVLKMAKVLKELAAELLDSYDPAKFGYLIALIDRATIGNIQVIFVDTSDAKMLISERDEYMANLISLHLLVGEKALWLGGIAHLDGISDILAAHLRVSTLDVLQESMMQR